MRQLDDLTHVAASGPIRVLLIEDNPGDAELARSMLQESSPLSFEVQVAATLVDGLVQLRRAWPDVVVLDLSLPDSDGIATLSALRAEAGHVPILVMTGDMDEERALRILREGADSYLTKQEACPNLLVRMLWHAIERQRMAVSLEESLEREHQVSTHDALTGLPNRTSFQDRLGRRARAAKFSHETLAVVIVDIDRFRRANDRYGQSEGDVFLCLAAERIASCLRVDEALCRIGGDEFGVSITGFREEIDAARVAARILEAFQEPMSHDGNTCVLSASAGIAIFPQDGADPETLTSSAEMALYHAKRFGGDRFEFYRPELNASAAERLDLELELRTAVRDDQLVVYYQPKIDASTMKWCGSEALVRWQHPERGLVPPGKFIPVAEEAGLIGEIGDWVLGAACRQGKIWQDRGGPALPVSVNVSARQFENQGFADQVLGQLEASGLAPGSLELEITESTLMNDLDKVQNVMRTLRSHGVLFSIDDFGTGYSSLAVLRSLPVDTLKVDRSFVMRIAEDERDAGLAGAIVALAHGLGIGTIAEGVETPEQAELLSSIGCRQLQGFLFSPPVPGDVLDVLLADPQVRLRKVEP